MRLPSCIDVHHNSAPEDHPRLAWRAVGGSEAACVGSNGFAQTLWVFFLFLEGCGDLLLLLPERGPSRVCWRSWSGTGDYAQPPGRRQTGSSPKQLQGQSSRHGTAPSSSFGFLGGKGPRSAAEWPLRPWKRSFCSSIRDRNGTPSRRWLFRLAPFRRGLLGVVLAGVVSFFGGGLPALSPVSLLGTSSGGSSQV